VTVLLVDLDDFKLVNDHHGHQAGDKVLREVAAELESCLREGDLAARLGGDEFGLLLPQTDLARADCVALRLLAAIQGCSADVLVTATIGIAQLEGSARRVMLQADIALYEAKAAGGNRAAGPKPGPEAAVAAINSPPP
jgi:two-component system cell cycle response regulator